MSDIAPFVAATLRDKVVADLIEENKKLREDLNKARTVQITGQNGEPVHVSALFSDGRYGHNPNLWQVDFPQEEEAGGIALSALSDTEIRVGGILRTRFRGNETLHGMLDSDELDGEDRKVINFCCNERNGALWLIVLVQGWPEASWRQVAAEEEATRGTDDTYDMLEVLSGRVARDFPDATVRFLHVAFFVDTVQGAIDELPLDESVEEDRERRREDQDFLFAVIARMRAAGDERLGAPFMESALELVTALDAMGIHETGGLFDSLINELIRLQQMTGGGDEFQNILVQGLQRQQDRQRRSDDQDFLFAVLARMRAAGDERLGAPFRESALELIVALDAMGIHETGELFDSHINELIRLQQVTGGGDEFQNAIIVQGLQRQQANRDTDMENNEENMDNDEYSSCFRAISDERSSTMLR